MHININVHMHSHTQIPWVSLLSQRNSSLPRRCCCGGMQWPYAKLAATSSPPLTSSQAGLCPRLLAVEVMSCSMSWLWTTRNHVISIVSRLFHCPWTKLVHQTLATLSLCSQVVCTNNNNWYRIIHGHISTFRLLTVYVICLMTTNPE